VSVGFWTGSITYAQAGITVEFGAVDSDGVAWTWRGVDGWDGPPVSGTVAQRAGDHGGWLGPQYHAPRPLTLRVSADAPTQQARDAARARLQQAVPVSDLATLVYGEPTPKQVYVRRSGSLTEECPNLTCCDFTIGLVAPDHRKYGTDERTAVLHAPASAGTGLTPPLVPPLALPDAAPPATADAYNAGNVETRPVATVTGAIAGPTLTNLRTGAAVSYPSLTLAAADTLTVDFDARQGYLNGAFRPATPASAWWELLPGANTIQLSGESDGTAAATVVWRDAYL
jgi:hypothetical protein